MYTITVRYNKGGLIAMNLKADTIALAREKAMHMQSQAFHVEIEDIHGQKIDLFGADQL